MENPAIAGTTKVAIPRLSRPGSGERPGELGDDGQRARVKRACISCRKRKVKCSGDTPRCVNCVGNDLDCVYDTARRDQLKLATNKNKELFLLLKELSLRPSLDDTDKSRIEHALEEFDEDSTSVVSPKSLKRKLSAPEELPNANDENSPTGIQAHDALDSEEGLTLLDEDLLRSRSSRSTGYVGQGSGVQWLRSLQESNKSEAHVQQTIPENNKATATPEQSSTQNHGPPTSVTDASFYLDADSPELDVNVDPYELPPRETATKLFACYKQCVHTSFPILPPQFEDQFRRYFEAVRSERPFSVPDRWLAILNIVFAIGARFSHLINAGWQGEERDHLVYMTRSVRLLGFWPFDATPDLALIQVSGLLAFYYQVIGHVSRGWVMIGISIRLALALGLHLHNEDPDMPSGKKEILLRTWWTLHAIECQLSAITGRPCVLGHEDCTVALPMALSEETASSSDSTNRFPPARGQPKSPTPASSSKSEKNRRLQTPRSYLDAHLNIGLIMQKLLSALYSPRTAQYPWTYIQNSIPTLLRELDDWKQGALPEQNLSYTQFFPPPDGPRGSLMLRFSYLSTKILITRPCLCRSRRKNKGQSDPSAGFDQQMAETCVKAALDVAELMPSSDPRSLYENSPWWSIVHIIMQAMAVLLLELSYGLDHMQGDRPEVKKSVKRMLGWLSAMRRTDAVVERAYDVIARILQQHKFQTMFDELLTEDLEDRFTYEYTPHVASSFGHSHPEQITHPTTNESITQMPPNQWYGGSYTANTQPEYGVFDQTMTDSQFLPQMGQILSSQAEQFKYLEHPYNNQFMFSNPFITSYDQDAPFGLTPDDLWSRGGTTGGGGSAKQQGVNYLDYPYIVNRNPPGGPQQPQ